MIAGAVVYSEALGGDREMQLAVLLEEVLLLSFDA